MILIYGLLWAFWRRWFGGAFAPEGSWASRRGVQAVAGIILMVPVFLYDLSSWGNWILAGLISSYLYAQFWSRGHGACFDIGRGEVNESIIARYNERWYHFPCDKLLEKHRYGYAYDFAYMLLRYSMPLWWLALADARYLLPGLAVAPLYALMWGLYEHEPWMFKGQPQWLNAPHKWAELASGFVFGAGLWWLR